MKKDKFVEETNVDQYGQQVSSVLSPDGRFELPDPVPMEAPIGYTAPPDITTIIKQMVRNEMLMKRLDEAGLETFEESDDFDIEDDPIDPLTPYERVFEAPPASDAAGVAGGGAVRPSTAAAPNEVSKEVSSGVPDSKVPLESRIEGKPERGPVSEGNG